MEHERTERNILWALLAVALVAVGILSVLYFREKKHVQDMLAATNEQVGMLQNSVSSQSVSLNALQTKLTALETTATTLCFVRLDMVWDDNLRREPYSIIKDTCGPDGYRCLTVGGDISPSCYNKEQCTSSCAGKCINISEIKRTCQ